MEEIMTYKERVHKQYRIQKRYLEQLEKIVAYKKSLPEYIESGIEVNERHVIEEAIEYYYVQTFGNDVMSYVIPQLTSELSNSLDLKFNNFFENMGGFLNALLLTENVNKEILGMLLMMGNFNVDAALSERASFEETVMENEVLYKLFEDIILKKNNL